MKQELKQETEHRAFGEPDEIREFPKGRAEILMVGDAEIGRLMFEPGWRWSETLKPVVQTASCEAPHFQYHVAGSARDPDGRRHRVRRQARRRHVAAERARCVGRRRRAGRGRGLVRREQLRKGPVMEQIPHEIATKELAEHLRPVFAASPDGVYVWLDEEHWVVQRSIRGSVRLRLAGRAERHAAPAPAARPPRRSGTVLVELLEPDPGARVSGDVPVPRHPQGRLALSRGDRHDPARLWRAYLRLPLRTRRRLSVPALGYSPDGALRLDPGRDR